MKLVTGRGGGVTSASRGSVKGEDDKDQLKHYDEMIVKSVLVVTVKYSREPTQRIACI